ncbi:MAG: putative transport system permease protein, partial [Frankiaceae bacterium]|nr:putative transport system permease protein [Frankiaceae bacterium]
MLRLALKGALARRLRLGLTAASIIIGVAFVSGTLVLTDTLNSTFDTIFGNAGKGVSVVVRGQQAFNGGGNNGPVDERGLVPDAVLQTVRRVPGVSSAIGIADGYAQLVFKGKAVVNGGAPNLGTAWAGNTPANPLHLVRGRAPAIAGEVVIDQKSADKFRIAVGSAADVVVSGRTLPVTVVGVVRYGQNSTLAGATLTAFSPRQAQEQLLGTAGSWTTVQASSRP